MGIPQRMDVSRRAIQRGRHLEQHDAFARPHVSRASSGDLRIARLLHQRRQPSGFQLGSAFDQHVRLVQPAHETRPRFHEMRILGRLRQRRDLDPVATDLPGKRGEIGCGGDHLQRGVGRHRPEAHQTRGQGEEHRAECRRRRWPSPGVSRPPPTPFGIGAAEGGRECPHERHPGTVHR
jgi:hypothetical protein